jgi:hypothetical protein
LAVSTRNAERYLRADGLGIQSVRQGDDHVIALDGDLTDIDLLISARERATVSGRSLALVVDDGPVHRVLDVCGALSILPTKAAA